MRSGFAEPDEYFAQFLPCKAQDRRHAQAEQPEGRSVDDAGNKKTRQGIHIANAKIERKLAAAKGKQQQDGEAPYLMGHVAPELERNKARGQPKIHVHRANLHAHGLDPPPSGSAPKAILSRRRKQHPAQGRNIPAAQAETTLC